MSTLEVFLGPEPVVQAPAPAPTTLLGTHLRHLSASSLGMALRCPRQFQRRYLFHEKQRPGEAIFIGSAFHEVLNHNYEQKIASYTDIPLSDAVQYMGDVAVPTVIEQEGGVDQILWDTDLDTAHKDAERIMSAYYRLVVPRIQPVGTEERFEIRIAGVEPPIIGYVDVRTGGAETDMADIDGNPIALPGHIIDTKTGKQATRKVKPSWQLQGRLYAQARNMPVEYHSVSRAKTPTIVTALESADMVVPVPTETQARNMENTIRAAAAYIEHLIATYGTTENEWPALGAVPDFTRNMLPCDFCGWREGCPAWA